MVTIDKRQLCPHEACKYCYRDEKNDRRCNRDLSNFLKCIKEHHGIIFIGNDTKVMILEEEQS